MIASLLDSGRQEGFKDIRDKDAQQMAYPNSFLKEDGSQIQPPLKFALVYSGFAAPFEHYKGFYEPKIKTPVLHFFGSLDTVVEEKRGKVLVNHCEDVAIERVQTHPGGHFLPSQKVWLDAALSFIRHCVNDTSPGVTRQEESVEDMDVPF